MQKTLEGICLPAFGYRQQFRMVCGIAHISERIIPVEAETNLKAKRLKIYLEKFSPEISVRTSMSDFRRGEWLVNLPLYAVDQIAKL